MVGFTPKANVFLVVSQPRIRSQTTITIFISVTINQGAVKGVYLKGLFAQSRLFYREMDCPVRFYREMDCPVQWSLATPSALESQSRVNHGSVVANPICKCRRHKAGHLQVRVAVGKRSTCVLKEAPLDKGPLEFPQWKCRSEFLLKSCLPLGSFEAVLRI